MAMAKLILTRVGSVLLVIGKVLLGLLLLILLLIALLLFTPLTYKGEIKKDENSFSGRVRLSWLWFVFRLVDRYESGENHLEIYLFGIPLLRLIRWRKNRKTKKHGARETSLSDAELIAQVQNEKKLTQNSGAEKPEEDAEEAAGGKPKADTKEAEGGQPEPESGEAADGKPITNSEETEGAQSEAEYNEANSGQKIASPEGAEGVQPEADSEEENVRQQEPNDGQKKRGLFHNKARARNKTGGKFRGTASGIYDKIKQGWKLIHAEELQGGFRVLKEHGMKLGKHVLPKKIKGFVAFGFDDPALTGQTLALLSAILPLIPEELSIEPDFTKKKLLADVSAKGYFFIFYLAKEAIVTLWNPEFRCLLHAVRTGEIKQPKKKKRKNKNRRNSHGGKRKKQN
jgi:hypothetical protein